MTLSLYSYIIVVIADNVQKRWLLQGLMDIISGMGSICS